MKIKNIFLLQKSDRQVLLFLLTLAVLACLAFYFLGQLNTKTTLGNNYQKDSLNIPPIQQGTNGYPRPRYYQTAEGRTAELFAFDPNTADSTQLLRLGLSPWQVRNIYKYRAKGGIYRNRRDSLHKNYPRN